MFLGEFDYTLPEELIAQEPSSVRDASRLMVLDRQSGAISHRVFRDLVDYLKPGDVLVVNNTRVFPARLIGAKEKTGGSTEALLLKKLGGGRYEALVKGRVNEGVTVVFGGRLKAAVESDLGGGRKVLSFFGGPEDAVEKAIEDVGQMPLPPYIRPETRDEGRDRERYQTVYASRPGAVAAPTAGLHFTPGLMAAIRDKGVEVAEVTLHVGIGTFKPVREEVIERHEMGEEEYLVPPESADAINAAKAEGRRVIAVGTTSARTLESASAEDGRLAAGSGNTRLFIYPGYRFEVVDALVTNFHLPKSTLLMLVCALAGREKVLGAYAEAVSGGYRFYSYGDAMFIF